MKTVTLITVFGENKPGHLARLTKALADVGVNIRWIAIATSNQFGVIKLLVNKLDLAVDALRKNGFTVSRMEVLAIEVTDKPGGLHSVAESLTAQNINLDNASGFVTNTNKNAVLLIETKNVEQAFNTLHKIGAKLLNQEEVFNL